jgi:hypothetical protein
LCGIGIGIRLALEAHDGRFAVLIPDLPITDVGAHEGEVRSLIARRFEPVPRPLGPVLVVSVDQDQPMPRQEPRIAMYVDVGHVTDVISLTFEESHELVLSAPKGRVVRERTVKGDANRGWGAIGAGVEALAAPVVVGLPRVHGNLNDGRGGMRPRLAYHEGNSCGLPAV